jgi:osmoprotectant transport system substrate-binding protein
MKRTRAALALAAVLALTAACGGNDDPLAAGDAPSEAAGGPVVVGSANFPENVLLAEIYAAALEAQGVDVTTRLNIGSRETYLPGLIDGSIDLIPEYSGVLLQYFDEDATAVDSGEVYDALQEALPDGLTVLEQSEAQDRDAVVVTRATADRLDLTSIGDLAPVAGELTFGGPPEFQTRPDGLPGLEQTYGVTFGSYRSLDAGGPLTVNALKNGQVDAADLFSTDPALISNDFVVLEDPKNNFRAQNVLPLLTEDKATDVVRETLDAVSAALDTETLTALLSKVVTDRQDPGAVAQQWLKEQGLV